MKSTYTYLRIGITALALMPLAALAWTGPSAVPPNNNVAAPVNTGTTDQFKPGVVGANILNIYGSSQYLSFGTTTGSAGYGMRNNAGALEFKGSGGTWGAVTILGNGNVGIGTTSPIRSLTVANGELSLIRYSDGTAYFNVSDATGSGSGNLYVRGLNSNGSATGTLGALTFNATNTYVTGNVGVAGASPTAKLTVGTAPGSAANSYYDIGAGKIAAGTSVYSYGKVCVGNASGDCNSTGGVSMSSTGITFPDGTSQNSTVGSLVKIYLSYCGGGCGSYHAINTWIDVANYGYTWTTAVNTDTVTYTPNGTGRITVNKAGWYRIQENHFMIPTANVAWVAYGCPFINGGPNCGSSATSD